MKKKKKISIDKKLIKNIVHFSIIKKPKKETDSNYFYNSNISGTYVPRLLMHLEIPPNPPFIEFKM